ncbi:MAG TPA: penicillin acylase family protein [Candidatus Limnocylindria bacterium]|nr:penicillin acylase family protein [Candidatus Limnocylindria bacterium]
MRRAGRLVVRLVQLLVLGLVLALIAVLVMGAITTQRGWPQTTGTISVAGLHRPATVTRDRAGIIQITADNSHDLFLAQGYIHAQERMWQMEISRRIGAGRLAELFGKGQVDTDTYIRTLGWRVSAQRDLAAMSPATVSLLQAYADGVNAWIAEHDGRLSTPFVVAGLLSGTGGIGGFTLEPWTPLDTATWQKVQAWSLGGNVDSEIFRLLADDRLGDPAKTDELFPPYRDVAPVITPTGNLGDGGALGPAATGSRDAGTATPGAGTAAAGAVAAGAGSAAPGAPGSHAGLPDLTEDHADALRDIARLGTTISGLAGLDGGDGLVGSHGVGSNNWVISGERTVSGKPILANDPHLGFGMPSIWIMNGLHCRTVGDNCPWDVVGVSFPGAPAVILGHNARIAWGATNVGPDTQDLFLETVDPSDPEGHYIHKGASLAYSVRQETIKVAGGADVTVNVRSTIHGVVLSDVDTRLEGGPVLAMRWTTTAEPDLAIESFFGVNTATTFDEFRAAFAGYGSPSQNFVYADVDGHIGYVLPGLIPVRDKAGVDVPCPDEGACRILYSTGERVRDGTSGLDEWTGYVPREELPWQLDPVGGMIVSANNAPVDGAYPHWLGNEWDPGYRAARVADLLADVPGKLTVEDMRAIQMDAHLTRADRVMLRLGGLGPATTTDDGLLLWQAMVNWDRNCGVDSLGCAAYVTVELALQRAIFDDELGPLAREWVGSVFAWEALIEALGEPDSPWWRNTTPGAPKGVNAADIVGAAIDETAAELRKAYGEPASWTWGRLHQVQFKESTLGSSGILPLELYLDPPARPVPGVDGAVNNNYYRVSRAYPDPADPDYVPLGLDELFRVTNGPSYRLAVDMGDLDGARIMITTGQSGNPFDPHYGDLIPLWAAGETVPLPFSAGNVAAGAFQTLTLTPL